MSYPLDLFSRLKEDFFIFWTIYLVRSQDENLVIFSSLFPAMLLSLNVVIVIK